MAKNNLINDTSLFHESQHPTKTMKIRFPSVMRCGEVRVVVRNRSDVNTVFGVLFRNIYGLLGLRKEDIVLDAGANIGSFSLLASRASKHVYSVEPDRSNYLQLLLNLKLNHSENVTPIEACLSNYDGTGYLTGENDETSLRCSFGRPVNVKTIDRIIEDVGAKTIDVVKMDIEGSEAQALYKQKFLSGVRELIIETHGSILEHETVDILKKRG